MEIQRAFQIAGREWENIRLSLETCGDIGEFDSRHFVGKGSDWLFFLRSIAEMENKLSVHGYFSQEAAHVFTVLASKAAEKLGFQGKFAKTFGSGYSWVRTGWFEPDVMEKQKLIMQLFFYKFFFPFGGDFRGWDFESHEVKAKLRLTVNTFLRWQEDPANFIRDVLQYRIQLEPLWHGLSLCMNFPQEFRISSSRQEAQGVYRELHAKELG
jgi:hypothetical protein